MTAFTLPQFGIFAQGTHAHHFLEFDLRPGVTPAQAVGSFRRLRAPEVSSGGVNVVIVFGADAWREVAPALTPASHTAFRELAVPGGRGAPARRPRLSTTRRSSRPSDRASPTATAAT